MAEITRECASIADLPHPAIPLSAIGVKRWQHDLWLKIIEATTAGVPNKVAFDWHLAFQKPALSRYGATSPKLLAWMNCWNEGKLYQDQVKPFGFLVSFMARTGPFAETIEPEFVDRSKRGRPTEPGRPKPIAPFERDHDKAAHQAFDRTNGDSIDPKLLKTYAEALAQFHLSAEDKFENGDFFDTGQTKRRHVTATSIGLIGKEANKVGASGEGDPTSKAQIEFESLVACQAGYICEGNPPIFRGS